MPNKLTNNQTAIIKVIGVGGGGNNAVNRMYDEDFDNVEFYVANTDLQVLKDCSVPNKIILGQEQCKGLGAGANPEVGRLAAIESEEQITEALRGADLVFIAAGMGGGTGTGASPEIARIAQDLGALTIAIVTKPFSFEGRNRSKNAIEGIKNLEGYVDSLILISNDKLMETIGSAPIDTAFREADNILKQGVQTITDLIGMPSQINLDFADIKTIMTKKGKALFGIGIASGENAALMAAQKAMTSSLLDTSIYGATDAIVNVTGGVNLTLNDSNLAAETIQKAAGDDLNIVFGMATNPEIDDNIIVTIIATGFDEQLPQTQKEPIKENNQSLTFLKDEDFLEATITNFTYNNSDEEIPSFMKDKNRG